jgi:hypothetical protein
VPRQPLEVSGAYAGQPLLFIEQPALIAFCGAREMFARGPLDEPLKFCPPMHVMHERLEGTPVTDAALVGQL